ncbi:7612_t:CDS:2, partial [Acaulospora colombiana]
MRESQATPRYERDEESQMAFRGQVPFSGNPRDLKPYGRPPMLPPQPYDRRPPYRGGAPYHVPYSRPGVGGPPPHGHRDFGAPTPYDSPYSRGSPLHPSYQRPPFHAPFQRPHLPPHLPIFPPKRPVQNISIFSPLHEKEISQSKQEDQRLRDEEWKLMVDLHKRRGELNKSTWEWTKVLHNTSLASQQMETLHTPEEIEALWKAFFFDFSFPNAKLLKYNAQYFIDTDSTKKDYNAYQESFVDLVHNRQGACDVEP